MTPSGLGLCAVAAAVSLAAAPPYAPHQADAHTRLLYHFDEGSGHKATDAGDYGNTGQAGSVTWQTGKFGKCADLDGDWDAVRCGKDGSLSPTDRITFEAWVKPDSVEGSRQVLSKDILGAPWYQYHLIIRDGRVTAGVTISPKRHLSVTADDTIESNRWTHLAGVYDGKALRLFVDGQPQSEVAEGAGTILDFGEQLNIGSWSNSYWFKGCIDEVRISSIARYGPSAKATPQSDGQLVFTKTDKPPTIDGQLSPGEWSSATALTGFRNNIDGALTSRPQPRAYVTFDEKSFYVAFVVPEADGLVANARGYTLAVGQDDAMEVFLDPLRTGTGFHQFLVGPNGAWFDLKDGNKSWSGAWTYRSSVKGGKWLGEIAIPFSTLGVASPYDGMECGFNLCRDYKDPLEWTSTAGVKGVFAQPKLFTPAVLRGGPASIRISSSSLRLAYRVVGTKEKQVEAAIDVSAIPPAQRSTVTGIVELANAQRETVAQAQVGKFVRTKGTARLSVSSMPSGDYRLIASLHDRAGVLLGSQETEFVKPDASVWQGNGIGVDHSVPPPWTPVRVVGNRVSCWNREYTFDGSPLPSQMRVGRDPILASAVRLVTRTNGREIVWRKGTTRFVEKHPDEARLEVENVGEALTLKGSVTTEFDGMARFDLELVPHGNASVEQLHLLVPLRRECATLRYILKKPADFYDPSICGRVPDEWHSEFKPCLWLGNEDLGLAWFAESAKGWQLQDEGHAIQITKDDEQVLLRVNFVDHAVRLTEPLSLTFGLQATPVKPVPRDWQKWRISSWPDYRPNLLVEWAHPWVVKYFAFPEPVGPDRAKHGLYGERIAKARADGSAYVQYINVTRSSGGLPEFRYYESGWYAGTKEVARGDVAAFGHDHMNVCPTTDWTDFLVHSLKKHVDDHGIDGFYVDCGRVWQCTNEGHGCGYAPGKGTYPIFATRELQKRIYKCVKAQNPNFILFVHSGAFFMPFISFFDMYVGGERFMTFTRTHDGNYLRALPLDVFRAEFIGQNWGLVPALLTELRRRTEDPKYTENLMALARIHGANVWAGMTVNNKDVVMKIWDAQDDFGIADAEFLPYWSNGPIVKPTTDAVKVSIFARKDRALLFAANLSEQDVDETLAVDLEKLGLAGRKLRARDVYLGQDVALKDGVLRLPIAKENFRMVVISE